MQTPGEVFDSIRHLVGSVPHVSNGFVCPYCLGPVTNYDQCFGCLQLFVLSGCPTSLREKVIPASSVQAAGGWYTRLRNYKLMQPEFRSALIVVLGYFYLHQKGNLSDLLGGSPTVVTIVPSKRRIGFENQPLRQVVATVYALKGVASTLVYNPEFTVPRNQYRPQAFDAGPTSVRNLSTTMGHSWGLIRERFPVWRGMGWED